MTRHGRSAHAGLRRGTGRRARLLALLAISAAAAGLTATTGAQPAIAAAAWSPPPVPGQQPALTMACAPGQVDLNHAPARDLQRVLELPGPVTNRLIESRPHDRVKDLLVVPGIGPGTVARIERAGKACSTPLTLPPSAADVCTAPGQIDVNDPQSKEALALLLGGPTAQRLVDAQPFPDLAHVAAVLVPGAGAGKIAKNASRLCLTPEPKTYAGVMYGWIYRSTGGRADYAGASLTVPAGTIASATGAWATIKPIPVNDIASGPTYDVHLDNGWADGAKHVFVELPQDTMVPDASDSTWTSTIVHGAGTEQEVLEGEAVFARPGNRVGAALTHLSQVESLRQPTSHFAFLAPIVVLPKSQITDAVVSRQVTAGNDASTGCSPDITYRTDAAQFDANPKHLLTGFRAVRAAALPCAQGDLHANQVTMRLTNKSALAFDMDREYQGAATYATVRYEPDVSVFTRRLLDHRSNSRVTTAQDSPDPSYGKGNVVDLTAPLGAEWTTVTLHYNPLLTSATFITDALGQIPGVGDVADFVNCIGAINYADVSPSSVVTCAEVAAAKQPLARDLLKKVARALDIYSDGRALVEAVGGVLDRLGLSDIDGDVYLRYRRPDAPVVEASGRFVPANCWTATGATWAVNEPCYTTFLASQAPIPGNCIVGSVLNPQCSTGTGGIPLPTGGGNSTTPPDTSGCWAFDPLAQAWVLNAAAGQGCLLLKGGAVFCGVGPCVPWPAAANRVVRITDGRSFFVDGRGGLWHLTTTQAYSSCTAKFPLLQNPSATDGKWQPDSLNNLAYMGEKSGC